MLIHKRFVSTLRVVKTGLMGEFRAFDNVYKHLGKESAKNLLKYDMTIKEESIWDIDDDNVLDRMSTYFVGGMDTYPAGAHENIGKFSKHHLMTLQPITDWKCPRETKEMLGIGITSSIDSWPFPITFPPKTKSDRKNSKKATNLWQRVDNVQYGHLEDSWGNNMFLLTRSLLKGKSQQLLIYRDTHTDMKGIEYADKVISEFQPTKIVLEYTAEGVGLSSFASSKWKLASSILRLRQRFVDSSRSSSIGARRHWQWLLWVKSFAISRAIEQCVEHEIPIALSDYNDGTRRLLTHAADALDVYSTVLWFILDFPMKKYKELVETAVIPMKFINMITLKIMPHFTICASYRNDLMALTINEVFYLLHIKGSREVLDFSDRFRSLQITSDRI